jgi:DNA-binding GntR family transcriptional regulator
MYTNNASLAEAANGVAPARRQQAYQAIREAIVRMELQPGQTLQEHALAVWLGMSRTPIREALRQLAAEGFVESPQPRRLIVAELSAQSVREAYLSIEVLEGLASREAARLGTPESCARIQSALDQMEAATAAGDFDAWMTADNGLHQAVHDAAQNRRASELLDSLYRTIERVRHMHLRDGSHVERLRSGFDEHVDYIAPIVDAQPNEAELRARHLFAHAREQTLSQLDRWVTPLRRVF